MPRELLTTKGLEAAVRSATARANAQHTRVRVGDGDNLMLIVRPGGGASWVLQYRLGGRRLPHTLGPWPTVGLKLARELAAAARERVARGLPPEPAATPAPAREAPTFRAMFYAWLALQRVSDVYRGNIEAAIVKDALPVIGAKPPAEVTRQDILAILRRLEGRGALEMLRRVRMWLKQAFEFGMDSEAWGLAASPVPTGHLKSFMAPARGHFPAIVDPAQVPALMRAIDAHDRPVVRFGLLFSAYVWQRPSEVREATWEEFDLDAAKWVIPASRMKLKREHWVPLAPQVVRMLREHAGVVGSTGWLLPGARHGQPLGEATLSAALEGMGFKGKHTPHGFRALARTILDEHLGCDERALEKQLAHEEANKVKRAYSRTEFWAERVRIMQVWADWLDATRRQLP